MARNGRAAVASFLLSAFLVACGARSELFVDDELSGVGGGPDAGLDAHADATGDAADADADALPDTGLDAQGDALAEGGDASDASDGDLDAPSDSPDESGDAADAEDASDASDADDASDASDAEDAADVVDAACLEPSVCDPNDPSVILQCGVVIEHCSELEQCEVQNGQALCVNPCLDTLGQDTSNGCEFYAAQMDAIPSAEGTCYAVFVVNQWNTGAPAKIEVTHGGVTLPVDQFARIPVGTGSAISYAPYDSSVGLAKDQVAILFLSRDPAALNDPNPIAPRRLADCPAGVTPAIVGDAAQHGTGVGDAFQIKTNVPVVAYQILPYGAGRARVTGATLLLPTNVWGTNYLAANAYSAPTLFSDLRAGPTMVILGKEDGTQVTVKPVVDILPGGGLLGTAADVPVTYTVNRGQYLQFTQPTELTGSVIESSQPVAVIGGSTVMDVPLSTLRADGAHQMLPPVGALASEYVAVRYRSRDKLNEEVVPWRFVGAVDGTELSYDPAPPPGAPLTLAARQLIEFSAPGPFVVRSQDSEHPFYVAAYMTGGQPFNGEGDPEFVNVIGPQQYLPRYTFFTDPTYPETNLVLVRQRDGVTGVFPDVTLDCAGLLGGWAPVGAGGSYELTRIDLSSGDFVGQNGCDNGVHVISGALPDNGDAAPPPVPRFGVTIWGWGNPITWPTDNGGTDEANPKFTRWVSYAYPAGANVATLNNVHISAQ